LAGQRIDQVGDTLRLRIEARQALFDEVLSAVAMSGCPLAGLTPALR